MNSYTVKAFFSNGASEGGHDDIVTALAAMNSIFLRHVGQKEYSLTRVELWDNKTNRMRTLIAVLDIRGIREMYMPAQSAMEQAGMRHKNHAQI